MATSECLTSRSRLPWSPAGGRLPSSGLPSFFASPRAPCGPDSPTKTGKAKQGQRQSTVLSGVETTAGFTTDQPTNRKAPHLDSLVRIPQVRKGPRRCSYSQKWKKKPEELATIGELRDSTPANSAVVTQRRPSHNTTQSTHPQRIFRPIDSGRLPPAGFEIR